MYPQGHQQQGQGSTSVDAYPWTFDQQQSQQQQQRQQQQEQQQQQQDGDDLKSAYDQHTSGPEASASHHPHPHQHQHQHQHHLPPPPPLPDYRAHDAFAVGHYLLNSQPTSANATPTSQHQQTPGAKYAEAPFYPFGDLEPPPSASLHLTLPPTNPFDNGNGGFGAMPSPGVVPPLPLNIERALSDTSLQRMDHPNPFSLVDVGPHSTVGPWSSGNGAGGQDVQDQGQGRGEGQGSHSNTFKFDHYEVLATLLSTRHDATPSQTPGSEASPFPFQTGQSTPVTGMSPGMGMGMGSSAGMGEGPSSRKGKERMGEWHLNLGRDMRRVRGEGHNEFEKDIALLQTYLTELVGLLQPFASTPTHTNPQRPPPFLHTRFLRLTSSVQQTLANLAPASHTYLSSDFTSAPPGDAQDEAKPSTKAEKEMEVIRKRRDMLIAKAAQAKATQAAQSVAGGFNPSAATNIRSSSSAPPGISHSSIPIANPPPHTYSNLSNGLAGYAHDLNGSRGLNGAGGDAGYSALGRSAPIHPDNPTGRCHSCGISVTMEWRKGPDGARTLCDSCGTHYAKLARRRSSASPSKIPTSLFG